MPEAQGGQQQGHVRPTDREEGQAELQRNSSDTSVLPAQTCNANTYSSLPLEVRTEGKTQPAQTLHKAAKVLLAFKHHLFFSCSSFSILWDVTYVEKR